MINLSFVERLLDLLGRSDAETIEIRKWTTTIRISKSPGLHATAPVTYQVAAQPAAVAPPVAVPAAAPVPVAPPPAGEAAGTAGGGDRSTNLAEIKSPMVGTFYAQPEPGAEPYVRVGSRVNLGQTLCIIEAMKIMNPLDAEVAGVVKEIVVQDAQPVEFGQVLFRVDPNE
jgi:acetyl-CoA carboxylase biotin carboxyl carrier protein